MSDRETAWNFPARPFGPARQVEHWVRWRAAARGAHHDRPRAVAGRPRGRAFKGRRDGRAVELRANREVILAAGSLADRTTAVGVSALAWRAADLLLGER
jgi:hypothetical protein